MDTITIELLYRCAGNYKTYFNHLVEIDNHPDIIGLKVSDMITMGELGTPTQEDFFGSEIHEWNYDNDLDHNLLEIVNIEPNYILTGITN